MQLYQFLVQEVQLCQNFGTALPLNASRTHTNSNCMLPAPQLCHSSWLWVSRVAKQHPVSGSHLVMLNTECQFNITRVLEYLIAYNALLAERYWTDVYLYISVICIKNCIQQLGFYLHRWMIECNVTTSSSAQVNPFHLCSDSHVLKARVDHTKKTPATVTCELC